MKSIWKRFIERIFPGTYDEYLESKEVHKAEIKVYRKNLQFIAGVILFFIPLGYLIFFLEGWRWKIIAVLIVIGEMLIRDAISEHYCALLTRKQKTSNQRLHSIAASGGSE